LIEKYNKKVKWASLSSNPAIFAVEYGIVNHMEWA